MLRRELLCVKRQMTKVFTVSLFFEKELPWQVHPASCLIPLYKALKYLSFSHGLQTPSSFLKVNQTANLSLSPPPPPPPPTYPSITTTTTTNMLTHSNLVVKILMALILGCDDKGDRISSNHNFPASTTHLPNHATITSLMAELKFDGDLCFNNIHHAAKDFGNRYSLLPAAVLYPKSVSDISSLVNYIFQMGPTSGLTVAARGHGHSLEGQAQAHQGVVINMESLGQSQEMHFHIEGENPFVDVSAGALWINILHESLKYGFAPKSWTDYLHLTVGGTLSNAGISGQAFRHGPQINNVYQLEVVTGTSMKTILVLSTPCVPK